MKNRTFPSSQMNRGSTTTFGHEQSKPYIEPGNLMYVLLHVSRALAGNQNHSATDVTSRLPSRRVSSSMRILHPAKPIGTATALRREMEVRISRRRASTSASCLTSASRSSFSNTTPASRCPNSLPPGRAMIERHHGKSIRSIMRHKPTRTPASVCSPVDWASLRRARARSPLGGTRECASGCSSHCKTLGCNAGTRSASAFASSGERASSR